MATTTNTPQVRKTTLRSQELTCPSCISSIEREFEGIPGVESVEVRYSSGRIIVRHDPDLVSSDDLIEGVGRAGYRASVGAF